MKKFSIFIPLYNSLDKIERKNILFLINLVNQKYLNDVDIIISDNSQDSKFIEFKNEKCNFVVNKGSYKNASIYNTLSLIEKSEFLVILDPDDRINIENLIDSYNLLRSDIIQIRWKENKKRNALISRLSNAATLNRTSCIRSAMEKFNIWNVKAADDYALNLCVLANGGTFEKVKTKTVYFYNRQNKNSVTNSDAKLYSNTYLSETLSVLDFHSKQNFFNFKPHYLYVVKNKNNYTSNKDMYLKLKEYNVPKFWLIIRIYLYWWKWK